VTIRIGASLFGTLLFAALAGLTMPGCGGRMMSSGDLLPGATMTSKCRLGASQTSVLVTEWSASEKANLEAMVGGGPEAGGVAVAFSGCTLQLVPECRVRGGYQWQRTTPGNDRVEISDQIELYTKLPLGAVSLSGELKRSGQLLIETTVAGQRRLVGLSPADVPGDGACARATHIVSGLSVGAFVLSAGGDGTAQASASVASIGEASGQRSRSARVVHAAGQAGECGAATDQGPSHECGSPLQVFLLPIPGRAEEVGAAGTVRVDFVSASASTRWDVYVDDDAACTTPCARWVDPERPLAMRARDLPDKVQVGRIDADRGPLQIAATPRSNGKFITGLTFTALGGMATISGISLTAIGCSSDERQGMCTAGLISLGAGALVTVGSVWLILASAPRASVRPLFQTDSLSLALAPTGLSGSF
jgi:hypothetical protein